jgi:hypothetical protein
MSRQTTVLPSVSSEELLRVAEELDTALRLHLPHWRTSRRNYKQGILSGDPIMTAHVQRLIAYLQYTGYTTGQYVYAAIGVCMVRPPCVRGQQFPMSWLFSPAVFRDVKRGRWQELSLPIRAVSQRNRVEVAYSDAGGVLNSYADVLQSLRTVCCLGLGVLGKQRDPEAAASRLFVRRGVVHPIWLADHPALKEPAQASERILQMLADVYTSYYAKLATTLLYGQWRVGVCGGETTMDTWRQNGDGVHKRYVLPGRVRRRV